MCMWCDLRFFNLGCFSSIVACTIHPLPSSFAFIITPGLQSLRHLYIKKERTTNAFNQYLCFISVPSRRLELEKVQTSCYLSYIKVQRSVIRTSVMTLMLWTSYHRLGHVSFICFDTFTWYSHIIWCFHTFTWIALSMFGHLVCWD